MNFHQFVAAVNSTSVFSITANPGPRGVAFILRTSKVLNTTHFKNLARLSPVNGYDYKSKAFVFTAKVDNFTGELIGAEKLLAVIEAAASSRETTKVALAERKEKLQAKRTKAPTEDEVELMALDLFGHLTPETLRMAHERLS